MQQQQQLMMIMVTMMMLDVHELLLMWGADNALKNLKELLGRLLLLEVLMNVHGLQNLE